jgi:hypothetical protein
MLAVLDLRAGILLAGKASHSRLYFIRLLAQDVQMQESIGSGCLPTTIGFRHCRSADAKYDISERFMLDVMAPASSSIVLRRGCSAIEAHFPRCNLGFGKINGF